jgi:uroporphyrinogen decarboxylase
MNDFDHTFRADEIVPFVGKPAKKRLLSAFRREPVDRVPNLETLYEEKHVEKFLNRYAGNTLSYSGDPAKGAGSAQGRPMLPDDYIDLCHIVGQDALIFNAGLWTPFMREDSEGVATQVSNKSIKNRRDFTSVFLDSDGQISKAVSFLNEYTEAVSRRDPEIGVGAVYGAIMQTAYEFVIGMSDFMLLIYDDLSFIEEILELSATHYFQMTKQLVQNNIDFVRIADDVAYKTGLFLRPEIMKKIWVPRIAKVIEPALNAGVPVMLHSDGNIDDLVPEIIDMGVSCINPLDPCGIDYYDYKRRYGSRLCLSGNIDIEFPLARGTPKDVYKDVKDHMNVLKPGFGYIASSSHSLGNNIPHKNVIAFLNAIHEYGVY